MGWNNPQLGNFIANDVPEIKRMLTALAKLDPSLVSSDIPSGAKRLVNISSGWQIQSYSNQSWMPITSKLIHDVDKLDGYHAAITPNANTVAVRNADKKLEGDITGNAATASSAATLSETLTVNKGGTGATTSAQARTNLGVPPTSHASSNNTYGLGSNLNYGHVRGDGVTTNVVTGEVVAKDVAIGGNVDDLASGRGVFSTKSMSGLDYNTLTNQGIYAVPVTDSSNGPGYAAKVIVYAVKASSIITQIAINVGGFDIKWRYKNSSDEWSEWKLFILETSLATASTPGIVKPGSGMSVNSAGSLGVDNTVVRTTGSQSLSGIKTFLESLVVENFSPRIELKQTDITKGNIPSAAQYEAIYFSTSQSSAYPADALGGVINSIGTDGKNALELRAYKFEAGSTEAAILGVYKDLDGTSYGRAPTPADGSNTDHIATTAWVRKKLSEVEDSINTDISTSSMVPDWGRWSSRTQNAAYTATENGYLYIRFACSPGESTITVKYTPEGGSLFTLPVGNSYSASSSNGSVMIPVKKGDAYTVTTSGSVTTKLFFIPAKK